jgi:hypothetical protein
MTTDHVPPQRQSLLEISACFGLLAALKLVILVADSSMRLFLGDSASYLHAALSDWVPPDRSYVYPLIIRATAVWAESIFALLAAQTLFGLASGAILFATLRHAWNCPRWLACAAAVLFVIEPSQLFYERMIMAESPGQLAFTLQLATMLIYVRHGSLLWIPLIAAFGVLAVSLRLSLLPAVLCLGLLAPVVRAIVHREVNRRRPSTTWLRFGLHLAVALLSTQLLHGAYQQWYGERADSPPGYIAHDGMMRLGLVAPLVRPEHVAAAGLDPALLDEVELPLEDHRAREAHIWSERGLFAAIRRHTDDPERAAGKISIRAARDAPFAMLRLSALTLADYFVPSVFRPRLQDDIGRRPLNEKVVERLHRLRYEATDLPQSNSAVTRYFEQGWWWLTATLFLLAPLTLAVLALRWRLAPDSRDATLVLVLASLGLVASHGLFSHIVSFRYLHALPWLMLANLALLVHGLMLRRAAANRSRAP